MESEQIIISNSSSSEESIHSISILLVDDDLTCLSIVSAMLKNFNYEVVMARHPQDAIYTLRLKQGAFDLVVSDVHMPDMDGFELQKAIAQEFHLPVVLMSADVQDGIVSKGLDNGAAFFIPKPVSADDLRDLWRFASTNKERQLTVQEIESLPDPETSTEKINLDEITISDSSVDEEDIDVEKDFEKKHPKKRVSIENKEVSSSLSPRKPKLVWSNTLHNHFLEAIRKIGLDKVVPKKILEVMDVPGLTRENVASHLQKYRIFLRRVADASLEIPYVCKNEGLTRRFISRLTPSGSTSILNKFFQSKHQNPWRFHNHNLSAASSSSTLTGSTYARILANKRNFCKPNVTCSNLMIHDNMDRSCVRFGENSSNQTRPSVQNNFATRSLEKLPMYDLTIGFVTSSSGENTGTSSNSFSVKPPKSFAQRSNYVGYRISNLQHLVESVLFVKTQGVLSNDRGVMDLPNAEIHGNNILNSEAEHSSLDDFLEKFLADSPHTPSGADDNSEKQLLDIIADYQKLIADTDPSLQNGMEKRNGVLGDDYSSLFDLDEVDVRSTDQSLDSVELSGFENKEQAHQDNQCHVSQEIESTPQLGETINQSLDEQQARMKRTNTDLPNSLEFNASSQLNNIYLSPTQVDDEDFLESLLFNFPI